MKAVRIHKKVSRELEKLDFSLKRRLAELFALLAEGENLGMPIQEIETAKGRLKEML